MPLNPSIKKVLVIGSGPIVIGQAAEFDYAGTQACRVLREAGVNIVLVNSNPATIMTDKAMADEIYLEPLNAATVTRILEKEKPDSLLAGLGGQTGLTIAMQLSRDGTLDRLGVRLLGTDASAIDRAEDRRMFKDTMEAIGQPVIPSDITNTVQGALEIAEKIGYPVIVRPAFTLGGAGGGVAYTPEELRQTAGGGLELSPITQVLIEKYIAGWKEIEFEAMRDSLGNVIAICSMENVDPVGVHTGDSVVVAPALTLSDKEYQMLRTASLDIVSALGIVGGCNCQFALNPDSFEYAVIEVNPRVSRSSALASKATGYPIAKVTAKLALGYTLDEIKNDITGKTCACFEPTVDYVVVKFPKWPFDKFALASRRLGSQMKATGEVMSIAPSFEMALMKAVRGAEISLDTLNRKDESGRPIKERLSDCDDHRLFTVFEALKSGMTPDEIFEITKIDRFFLWKLKNLADYETRIISGLTDEDYILGKHLGYTDKALARLSGRKDLPTLRAAYKMVDTCAAEFSAETPYFYATFDGHCEARDFLDDGKQRVVVLGSGPIRIGQGIEFDYSSVHCVRTLREMGYDVVIVNNNPETVSTDYDTADRLYFEPLNEEDVLRILDVEKPVGVVVAFGGQTAIRLTQALDRRGVRILGTSAEGIDVAEDRARFDQLLETLGIKRPAGMGVRTLEDALRAGEKLGYPVLLRPSYVIGGQNMVIAHEEKDVRRYMDVILAGGIENPVLIDRYMQGTELEVDVISDGKDVLIPGIMEHIERAGVHSGDSIAVYPPYNLNDRMLQIVVDCSEKLALALGTQGLVNIQYLIWKGELYVIEVNPRASRTVPYISKVTGVPMVSLATRVMLGEKLKDLGFGTGLYKTPPYFAVKVPVFSFEKLAGANATLGPEMKSTGEVLGVGKTLSEALFKGLTASGLSLKLPEPGKAPGVLVSCDEREYLKINALVKKLADRGFRIYATPGTARLISGLGIQVTFIGHVGSSRDAYDLIDDGHVSYVVYTGALEDGTVEDFSRLNHYALVHSVACFSSLDTAMAMADVVSSRYTQKSTELVDICHLRSGRQTIHFTKMQDLGNDAIYVDNRQGLITCPESLAITLCDRHIGVGADGLVLIENSDVADAKMRMFNLDGSEGGMAGNPIRCVGKYLFDKGIVRKEEMTVETRNGVHSLSLCTFGGEVGSVAVDMGKAEWAACKVPVTLPVPEVIDYPAQIGGMDVKITCLSMGNPHCVVFEGNVDAIDLGKIGPLFENAAIFPERVNTEFVHVVDERTLIMRVYERGSGETRSCGTGACAAVAAAVKCGLCEAGADVTVKLRSGDLTVNYTPDRVILTGNAQLVFEGDIQY